MYYSGDRAIKIHWSFYISCLFTNMKWEWFLSIIKIKKNLIKTKVRSPLRLVTRTLSRLYITAILPMLGNYLIDKWVQNIIVFQF